MKAILLTAAVIGFSSGAWASKARVGALQGAFDIEDIQTAFTSPSDIHSLGQLMTFEMGSTSATGTPKAEGGFLMKKNGAVWGAYLGHANVQQNTLRGFGATAYPKVENPVDIFYGKDDWAMTASLSQSEDVENDQKQLTVSAGFGKRMGDSRFGINADIIANADAGNATEDSYNGAPILKGFFRKDKGEMAFQVGALYGTTKQDATGNSVKVDAKGLDAMVLHRPIKDIYYGAGITFLELDAEGTKTSTSGVPLFLGIEKDVLSWATFRASVKQNFLFGETKTATPTKTRNKNDTTVAMGLGFKHNGFTLDGRVAGQTSGKVDGNTMLAEAAVTYQF